MVCDNCFSLRALGPFKKAVKVHFCIYRFVLVEIRLSFYTLFYNLVNWNFSRSEVTSVGNLCLISFLTYTTINFIIVIAR